MAIQTFTNFQSTLIKFSWINFDNRSRLYTGQIKNQVTMLTENIIKTFDIWNPLIQLIFQKRTYKSIPKQ
jgi:hypothetical protein